MDVPLALTNMLNHLLSTHGNITSWNIYQGDNGIVNVNIRFPNINNESSVDSHVEPVTYKCVSSRQLARNKVRANTYKSKQQQSNAHTQTDHVNMEMDSKKRKFESSTPEC